MKIAFFGREAGLILKDKLQKAGFELITPEASELDLIVVGYYGKILPKKVLEKPRYGALNVHPSLLPTYRGPAPIQTTILNGDTQTGVTIIQMDEEVDHGPIVAAKTFEIGEKHYTTPELTKELWELGGNLLLETIPQWVEGKIPAMPQNHSQATYTKLLKREDGRIDWNNPAEYIERQVRAYTLWPGTFTSWNDKTVKILSAELPPPAKDGPLQIMPGKVFQAADGNIGVGTGKGVLIIKRLQLEGGKPIPAKEFLLGNKILSFQP